MERKDTIKKFLAGLFFIVGITLFLIIVFLIGVEKGMTEPKFQITVLFRDIGGLALGAPVRLSGVDVGTVSRIDLLLEKINGHGVKVVLNIFRKYHQQLETPAIYAIKTEGILGQKMVEITPLAVAGSFDLSKPIIGQDPLDVQNLAEAFRDTAVSLTGLTTQAGSIMKELQYLSRSSKRIMDRIEDRIIEGQLWKLF